MIKRRNKTKTTDENGTAKMRIHRWDRTTKRLKQEPFSLYNGSA